MALNNETNILPKKIRASVIIPLYNIEIILVNDFSSDNTSSVVEQIKKNETRIKILYNKKNMGQLFSRSIGVLYAKGQYIFHLDSDDMFLDKDIFSYILNIANQGNYDIISFKAISSSLDKNNLSFNIREHWFTNFTFSKVVYQPELGLSSFRPGKKLGSFTITESIIWNKCVKTKVYQKTLNKMGKERYSRHMIFDEDRMVIYGLFNVAESMRYIQKYGILNIKIKNSISRRKHESWEYLLNRLYILDIVILFSKESFESRLIIIYLIIYILDNPVLHLLIKLNEYNKKLIILYKNFFFYFTYNLFD